MAPAASMGSKPNKVYTMDAAKAGAVPTPKAASPTAKASCVVPTYTGAAGSVSAAISSAMTAIAADTGIDCPVASTEKYVSNTMVDHITTDTSVTLNSTCALRSDDRLSMPDSACVRRNAA